MDYNGDARHSDCARVKGWKSASGLTDEGRTLFNSLTARPRARRERPRGRRAAEERDELATIRSPHRRAAGLVARIRTL
jgi:hypothetical protein